MLRLTINIFKTKSKWLFFSSVQNHCYAKNVCLNNGECSSNGSTYRCRCNFFYYGKRCEKCKFLSRFYLNGNFQRMFYSEFKSNTIYHSFGYNYFNGINWILFEIWYLFILSAQSKVLLIRNSKNNLFLFIFLAVIQSMIYLMNVKWY